MEPLERFLSETGPLPSGPSMSQCPSRRRDRGPGSPGSPDEVLGSARRETVSTFVEHIDLILTPVEAGSQGFGSRVHPLPEPAQGSETAWIPQPGQSTLGTRTWRTASYWKKPGRRQVCSSVS